MHREEKERAAGASFVSCQDILSLLQEQQHEEEDDAVCNEAMDAFECQPFSNSTSFNKVEVVSILRLQEPFNLILNLTWTGAVNKWACMNAIFTCA